MGSIKVWVLGVLLFACSHQAVRAQTFSEWFRQGSTQKKYLLQQIAALQVYVDFLGKGYGIVRSGLNTVRDITNGEFHLHDLYISSLKLVNPAIRNDKRVAEIAIMQDYIFAAFGGLDDSMLGIDKQCYIHSVKTKVLAECDADWRELLLVITSGKVEMTDEERLARLDKVYLSMQEKTAFTQSIVNQVGLLISQRNEETESLKKIRRFYEIN